MDFPDKRQFNLYAIINTMKKLLYILREIFKFRNTTFTKVISLTIGLFVGVIAFSYCTFEMNYDNFHKDAEHIFRIGTPEGDNGSRAPLVSELKQEMPEIKEVTCFSRQQVYTYQTPKHTFYVNTIFADTSFFRIFSFQVLSGNPHTDLNDPHKIFISQKWARILFGEAEPRGQEILCKGKLLTVAGVFQDIPRNSHLMNLTIIRSMESLGNKSWEGPRSFQSYLQLKPHTDLKSVEQKVQAIANRHEKNPTSINYILQPLQELHLKYGWGYSYVIIVGGLGFIIVLVSALNYILIAISDLVHKAKEIGIHKVNGASTTDVFYMFLTETILLLLLAGLLSIGFIWGNRSFFENIMYINYADIFNTEAIFTICIFILSLILVTGVIPARIFAIVPILQIFRQAHSRHHYWKYALLWCQFASACLLITLVIIFTSQFRTLMNRDLGYSMERLYCAEIYCGDPYPTMASVKAEISRLPFVSGITFVDILPLWVGTTTLYDANQQGITESCVLYTDKDFFPVMGIPILEGENPGNALSKANGAIVNEKFIAHLKNIGKGNENLFLYKKPLQIESICRDFQVQSLYASQQPLVIQKLTEPDTASLTSILIRLQQNKPEDITLLQHKLKETSKRLISFEFYKYKHQASYEEEEDMCLTVQIFACLAIVIAILGLTGFTGDEVARRTKEIAIRKVNGASSLSITLLLLQNICYLALFSIPFALAGAYYFGSFWLEDFAYRIPLNLWILAGGAFFTLLIILITVLLKSQKGIRARPAKALKSE